LISNVCPWKFYVFPNSSLMLPMAMWLLTTLSCFTEAHWWYVLIHHRFLSVLCCFENSPSLQDLPYCYIMWMNSCRLIFKYTIWNMILLLIPHYNIHIISPSTPLSHIAGLQDWGFLIRNDAHGKALRYCRAYSVATIIRRVGSKTGFIGSHTITVYTLYNSLQFTITLPEFSHCIFTRCLSSNIAGSVRLQLCNSSLKTAARPEH
jgi:hypothetical protein